jgi:hypothetical protein
MVRDEVNGDGNNDEADRVHVASEPEEHDAVDLPTGPEVGALRSARIAAASPAASQQEGLGRGGPFTPATSAMPCG